MQHTGSTILPRQVTIIVPSGGTSIVELPFGNSILIHPDAKNFPAQRTRLHGAQALSLPEATSNLNPRSFTNHPVEVEIALGMIADIEELLSILLEREGMRSAAWRLAGALRITGRLEDADRIIQTMRLARHAVRESNPFNSEMPTFTHRRERSPYVLWPLAVFYVDINAGTCHVPSSARATSGLGRIPQTYQ